MCNAHELTRTGPCVCGPLSPNQGFEVVHFRVDNLVWLRALEVDHYVMVHGALMWNGPFDSRPFRSHVA